MAASVIRSRAMVTHAIDRHRWHEVTDGAVLREPVIGDVDPPRNPGVASAADMPEDLVNRADAAGAPDHPQQEDGTITEIGTYQELRRKYPNVAVVGSGNEVMLPGFVNGHHHIGLTPVQLGSPDMPLELWFVTRMVMRNVDL
jgi:5-methylthioadenosine/S-adenosylhomocysteine deaminase